VKQTIKTRASLILAYEMMNYKVIIELSLKLVWLVYYTLFFMVCETKATRKGDRLTARDG
jgi:hypothetical protein